MCECHANVEMLGNGASCNCVLMLLEIDCFALGQTNNFKAQ